jgi:hypothetical protein
MLTEEWVRDTILDNLPLGAKKLMAETNSTYYVVDAAAKIAQAAGQDRIDALAEQDAAWHEIEEGHIARIKILQRQVSLDIAKMAGMAEALRASIEEANVYLDVLDDMPTYIGDLIGDEGVAIQERAGLLQQQALSTAPKVLLSEQFQVSLEEQCAVLRSEGGNSELRTVKPGAMQDGQIVTGVVLSHEQEREQEE